MHIHVSNLSPDTTPEDLRNLFAVHGEVSGVTIQTEDRRSGRNTGTSKGYGFVIMPDGARARLAVAALDHHELRGCPMGVKKARPERITRGR